MVFPAFLFHPLAADDHNLSIKILLHYLWIIPEATKVFHTTFHTTTTCLADPASRYLATSVYQMTLERQIAIQSILAWVAFNLDEKTLQSDAPEWGSANTASAGPLFDCAFILDLWRAFLKGHETIGSCKPVMQTPLLPSQMHKSWHMSKASHGATKETVQGAGLHLPVSDVLIKDIWEAAMLLPLSKGDAP